MVTPARLRTPCIKAERDSELGRCEHSIELSLWSLLTQRSRRHFVREHRVTWEVFFMKCRENENPFDHSASHISLENIDPPAMQSKLHKRTKQYRSCANRHVKAKEK